MTLIRTPRGWVEPGPTPCPCGSTRIMLGWTSCSCAGVEYGRGHRTWVCRDCDLIRAVGCVEADPGAYARRV